MNISAKKVFGVTLVTLFFTSCETGNHSNSIDPQDEFYIEKIHMKTSFNASPF